MSNPHPGRKWRTKVDVVDGVNDGEVISAHSTDTASPTEFDELAIDDWFHLERMDERFWWARIGDAYLMIAVHPDGRAAVTIERGQYGPTIERFADDDPIYREGDET